METGHENRENKSFRNTAMVACAVMKPELEALREQGFLDTDLFFFTSPGNHDMLMQMDKELRERLREASLAARRIIILLGTNCYFNPANPDRTIDVLIAEIGIPAVRVPVHDCHDMLMAEPQRQAMKRDRFIYLMTPGWFVERQSLFGHWDQGKINETFPRHDAAVMVDAIGFYDDLMNTDPEALLAFTDWMGGLPLESHPTDLERLKTLLLGALGKLNGE